MCVMILRKVLENVAKDGSEDESRLYESLVSAQKLMYSKFVRAELRSN